ncbi:MAG TPA: molybdate ABC transporter permease subunit [Chloroflexia bacterium]|nr:molybdate ABC transporter permease subunit [Chloroflexia bacterium]
MNWSALGLTLQVTAVATLLLSIAGLILAFILVRVNFPGKVLVEALIQLPLILPPTVTGYYLLVLLGRGGPLMEWFKFDILFSWPAAAIASAVVGLPLMVQASKAAISSVDPVIENAARTLGSSEWDIVWRITLPVARRGILAGLILGAARAMGDFGATLMVAGNIPDRTQTLSLAVYDAVQNRDYDSANLMVVLMSSIGFASLWIVHRLERPRSKLHSHLPESLRKPQHTYRAMPSNNGENQQV